MHAKWERIWGCCDNQEVGLEAAILERKRNSSLVKRLRADNPTGLKHAAEAAAFRSDPGGVGEHSVRSEVAPEGAVERTEETLPAQVAIKSARIGLAESLRFPEEGSSAQG